MPRLGRELPAHSRGIQEGAQVLSPSSLTRRFMSTYCRCHAGVYPCPRLAGRTYRSSPLTVLDRAQDLVSTDTLWLASCRLSIGWQIIEIPLRVARSRRAWQAWGPALQIAPY